jgi:hypothetical protein
MERREPPSLHRLQRFTYRVWFAVGVLVLGPELRGGPAELTIDPVGPPEPSQQREETRDTTRIDLPTLVQLRLFTIRWDTMQRSVIDLEHGEIMEFGHGSPEAPQDVFQDVFKDGATVLSDGTLVVWQDHTVRAYVDGFDEPPMVHEVEDTGESFELIPPLRVIASVDEAALWVVQVGGCCPDRDGHAELVELATGQVILSANLPGPSHPVADTARGLVLNTQSFIDTGDGFVAEPGSRQSLLLTRDGAVSQFATGEVVAANRDSALALSCINHAIRLGCVLHLIYVVTGDQRNVATPNEEGDWATVNHPNVPGPAHGWRANAPDGRFLVGFNARPPSPSFVVVVDPESADATTIWRTEGYPASSAGWDRTGDHVVIVDETDLIVVDPVARSEFRLTGIVPPGQHVFARM